MEQKEIEIFVESALLAAGRPLSVDQLQGLFDGRSAPEKAEIRSAIQSLNEQYEHRGITIAEVASGFRMQIRSSMADRLQKLWEERPPRYSRALFETLALIAYRQPITRGEIEEIRGVSVSSNIMRSLAEREWVRVVGHRDVPGRPEMFGTTKAFLDYFSLKRLEDLPELADLADWESLRVQLDLPDVDDSAQESNVSALPVLRAGNEDSAEPDEGTERADFPELSESAEEDVRRDAAADDGEESPAEDAPGADEDELVVSEWPDPADDKSVATFEVRHDKKDASANNG